MRSKQLAFLAISFGILVSAVSAGDVYYSLPLNTLRITGSTLPDNTSVVDDAVSDLRRDRRRVKEAFMQPYAVTEDAVEVYVRGPERNRFPWLVRRSLADNIANTRIVLCAERGQTIRGSLYLPKANWSGMQAYPFEISKASEDQPGARTDFLEAKEHHYRSLLDRNIPGAAWYRYQTQAARSARDFNETDDTNRARRRIRESQLQRSYSLFSGGRALSENLQLDRELWVTSQADANVPLDSLTGITVSEIDWESIVKDLAPQKDPLANYIPADQHVLFFPSFMAMTHLIDEVKAHGTPILQLLDPRSEDAQTHERYEKQLCLSLDTWARLLGPALIHSIAMTGSDPYLRSGSDVAFLFESPNVSQLKTGIQMQYQMARAQDARVQSVTGTILGYDYQGVKNADRSVCSYMVVWDKTVLVTNSLVQLEKIVQAKTEKAESLQDLDEYTFFRDRYKRDEAESALVVITDAAIRRWCGPRWRIGASRRVRAGAFLSRLQAKHMGTLVKGLTEDQHHLDLTTPLAMGTVALTSAGITSSVYGSMRFQTPIAELDFDKVTRAEADAYNRYRNLYQRRWQQFFDPIAIRFNVLPNEANRIAVDLTVRPLIASTEYQRYIEITRNHGITPQAGDPHTGALGQVVLSIDRNAPPVQQAGSMAAVMAPGLQANALGWLGDWVSLYVDGDAFWQEFQEVASRGSDRAINEFMENNLARLPIALHVDVRNSLKLAGFLVAARTFIAQTAPNMTVWDNLTYRDQAYVRVRPAEQIRERSNVVGSLALYYVVTPQALVVSLSEPIIHRAIDRQQGRPSEPDTVVSSCTHDWLGQSLAVHVKGEGLALAQALFDHNATSILRQRSWANLIILNEWQRRYGESSPVTLHQRLWQTKLVCPGGGDYVWNESLHTMESTVFGCPARPKTPEHVPNALTSLKDVNMGLTFEENGLRARAEIRR